MAADPVFIDTNVLIYAGRPDSPQHGAARAALQNLQQEGRPLWISPQVLREYLAAVTRPQGGAAALSMGDALADARRLADLFNVLEEGRGVLDRLFQLLADHPGGGKQVHDANLVATMLDAGLTQLLTFNTRDFARFGGLIQPMQPVGGR